MKARIAKKIARLSFYRATRWKGSTLAAAWSRRWGRLLKRIWISPGDDIVIEAPKRK